MNRFLRLSLIGNASVYVLGLISLTFSMGAARADITRDLQNQRPLLVIFQNATADGMTIEAAVTAAMRALPDRAGDIVAAAVLLMSAGIRVEIFEAPSFFWNGQGKIRKGTPNFRLTPTHRTSRPRCSSSTGKTTFASRWRKRSRRSRRFAARECQRSFSTSRTKTISCRNLRMRSSGGRRCTSGLPSG